MKSLFLVFVLLVTVNVILALDPYANPYDILGVKKSASMQDVRKAYKKLVKEWHPDKNSNPAAANKFVEITQAYELLTDPERRKLFDNRGIINPDSSHRPRKDHNFDFDPFEDLFGYQFTARDPDITLFHKLSITTRAFENNLLPKSLTTPHLLLFYSDWCFSCLKIEPIWRRIVEELEPIGIELATVHHENEAAISKKCGVVALPSLVLLVDGKHYLYRDHTFSVHRVVQFIRSKFPYRIIQPLTDHNVDDFLAGWGDNRVRAIVCHKAENVRLRYLVTAFHYRDRISFGFVHLGNENTKKIQSKYKISTDSETLLLFNENISRPVASVSMAVISTQTMRDIINANQYLMLPRLSSQNMLDSVCPVEWSKPRKRLCVVVVAQSNAENDETLQAMRHFIQDGAYNSQRVHFSYIYKEKQAEFLETISDSDLEQSLRNVVILWRRDASRVKYEWFSGRWHSYFSPEWNQTKQQLENTIAQLLKTDQGLASEAIVKELIDEHAQSRLARLVTRFLVLMDVMRDSVKWDYFLVTSSALITIGAIVGGGYFMAYLMRLEEEKVRAQEEACGNGTRSQSNGTSSSSNGTYTPQLRIHELRAEKYNGMVRLLKPGCRTIVLLVDQQSKAALLPGFHSAVWPYRKNKTLMFGFMCIERGIEWYTRILTLSLPEPRQLQINPRNCIGTVLCLNGHRKYFCMYHAKHPECTSLGSKRMMRMTKTLSDRNASGRAGGFMGFGDSSDSDSDTPIDLEAGKVAYEPVKRSEDGKLLQKHLLDGLPNWLDRLFEGSTHRYYINYWPDFLTK